jgi:hypothetical protein
MGFWTYAVNTADDETRSGTVWIRRARTGLYLIVEKILSDNDENPSMSSMEERATQIVTSGELL